MNTKLTFAVILLAALFFSSCKNDKAEPIKDDKLDIAIKREPKMIHPVVNPLASSRALYQSVFVPMADFHPDTYELQPILIKELPLASEIAEGPFKGGTKYTIEFKEEAKWDNGDPITAKDLEFTFKAVMHPGTNTAAYASYLRNVSDIELDPNNNRKASLVFKDYYILAKELVATMEVYPQYHYDAGGAMDKIDYKDLFTDKGKELASTDEALKTFAENFNSVKYGREMISGAGPYKFKNWISNQMIVLEKKDNYWGEGMSHPALKTGPQEIIFHVIPDETSVISQLKEGNIDMYPNMSANTFLDLKGNEQYGNQFEYFTPELMKFYYIAINNSKPELSDPDVRRALAEMVDMQKIVDVIEQGYGHQTVGIFNKKKPYYNSDLKPIVYNIEGAKKILSEEGWKDTNANGSVDKVINGNLTELDLDMYITGSELSKNIALLFQESAKEAGVKVNIITKAYKDFKAENLKKRNYDLAPLSITQEMVLDDPFAKWHSSNDDPTKGNDVSYRSKEADELIDKIRATKVDSERNEYYSQLQEVMYKDQPVIFLYSPVEKIVLNKKWKGSASMKRPGYMANTFSSI